MVCFSTLTPAATTTPAATMTARKAITMRMTYLATATASKSSTTATEAHCHHSSSAAIWHFAFCSLWSRQAFDYLDCRLTAEVKCLSQTLLPPALAIKGFMQLHVLLCMPSLLYLIRCVFFWLQNRGRIILLLLECASTRRYPESARGIVMSQVARVLWERGWQACVIVNILCLLA